MSGSDVFNPPYAYVYRAHGPVTIYDDVGIGWIARVKESLPHKEELAKAMVDGLNKAAGAADMRDLDTWCSHVTVTGEFQSHDWRLIEEKELWRVEPGYQGKCLTYQRRWYCARCRTFEVTSVASNLTVVNT
jgi:hypothetical protein